MKPPLLFDGMQGLGDCLHQRALVRRALATSESDVWLTTPWPCLYHDLIGERFHLLPPARVPLRTQHKNFVREQTRYTRARPPLLLKKKKIWYDPPSIRATNSILGGMLHYTLRQPLDGADFSLPVPAAWRAKALARIGWPSVACPIMVLRPLVDRIEWSGCKTRNPDSETYAALYHAVRSRFFVVSIADLVDGVEWAYGDHLPADVVLHAGELDSEAMIGLVASAALTFCSPGFALIASQAVGTPVICVYGGRESSRFYEYGARFAPTLGIDPVQPCDCLLPKHECDKRIDLDQAHARIAHFVDTNVADIRRRA